ncbi:hypothetical protein CR513_57143, partial [Mucuna pruriens]
MTFDTRPDPKTIIVRFTVVNAWISYNMILVVSTPNLCMKYPIASQVGIVCLTNVLLVDVLRLTGPCPFLILGSTPKSRGFEASTNGRFEGSSNRPKSIGKKEDRGSSKSGSREAANMFPFRELGHLCLVARGQARNKPQLPLPSSIYWARDSPYVPREKEAWRGKEEGSKGGDGQVVSDTLHKGSLMSNLAIQYGDGQKSNGKWRVCTNYTNLNKVCPKDPYLLPSIDRLVNGDSGYMFISFMNTYSKYN